MVNALKIAWFEVRLIFTDRWAVFWLLMLPFVLIFFIAKAFPQSMDPSTMYVSIGVYNQDTGFLSQALVEDLAETGFTVQSLRTLQERPPRQWHRTLIIPAGFTEAVLQGHKVTLRLEIEPGSFQPALDAARVKIYKSVGRLIGNLCLMSTFPETADSEAVELAYARAADLEARVTLESSFAGQGKVVPSGYNLTVPGTIVMSIIFSVMTFGTAQFAQDRHSGLLRRLVTTPSLGRDILLGKLLGRVLLGFLQIIVLLVLSRLIFKVYLGHSVLAWFVCLVPYTLACAALGLFMGCIFRSEEQAGILGWIPAILMAALGGCWWPRELAPDFLNTIGYCFPPAWAVDGLQRIISYGDGPQAVLPHAAVQCAFFVLFMGLCIRFFRYD